MILRILGDKDKFKFLTNNLSTKFAIWKAMLNFDVNALEIIKNSLSWVRSNWIQEYLARQNEIMLVDADSENFSNISVIQMVIVLCCGVKISFKLLISLFTFSYQKFSAL